MNIKKEKKCYKLQKIQKIHTAVCINVEDIMKRLVLMLLSFLFIVSSLIFVSCSNCNGVDGGTDCVVFKSCSSDADCKSEQLYNICDGGECNLNPCEESGNECGLGKCIPHDDPKTEEDEWFYCQCDEGATISDLNTCFPACSTDSDCEEFAEAHESWSRNKYCKVEEGYCAVVR